MKEIERKYILKCREIRHYFHTVDPLLHLQWYLEGFPEKRIRASIDSSGEISWVLTRKSGKGMFREELETSISEAELSQFSPLSEKRCVIKLRYITLETEEITASIDRYLLPDIGCLAEIEVTSAGKIQHIDPLCVWSVEQNALVDVTDRAGFTASEVSQPVSSLVIDRLIRRVSSSASCRQTGTFRRVFFSDVYSEIRQ